MEPSNHSSKDVDIEIASLRGDKAPVADQPQHGDTLPPPRPPSNPASRLGERIFKVHERGSTWAGEFRWGGGRGAGAGFMR